MKAEREKEREECRIEMDCGENGSEREYVEFWPLQHPTEPPDEDKPLKCPISHTCLVNGQRRPEERFSDRLGKRGEFYSAVVQKQAAAEEEEEEEPSVRKRHHSTLTTHEDHTPLRMPIPMPPPIYPNSLQPQKLTIFHMTQHFNNFQS